MTGGLGSGTYTWHREKLRHVAIPVDVYCYIKAVATVKDCVQHEVFTDLMRKHQEALEELVMQGHADYQTMESMGAVFDEGEWYIIMDDAGNTERQTRVPLFEFSKRVQEEYQNNKTLAQVSTKKAQEARNERRQQGAAAGGGAPLVGAEVR